jgi:hypothetical protein
MNLTSKQWFQIVQGIVSSLITAGALFTTLFGQDMTLKIIAVLGLVNIIISSIGAALSGQANLVQDVRSMPGVDKVLVNDQANPTLAKLAVDPTEPKVGATTPAVRASLIETAKGA